MEMRKIPVWDLPVRLFHWLLVLLVAGAFVTGLKGGNLIDWHGYIGIGIIGLVVFRIIWGFVGSTYARFGNFLPCPKKIIAYLQGRWHGVGHNPLGSLSVYALLGLMIFQTVTGLFANDDIAFEGPLYVLVSKSTSDWMTTLHRYGMWLIVFMVSFHVLAILFYAIIKRHDLVLPMFTGVDKTTDPEAQPRKGGGIVAFVIAVIVAAGITWAAAGGLVSPPPPPPAQDLPAW